MIFDQYHQRVRRAIRRTRQIREYLRDSAERANPLEREPADTPVFMYAARAARFAQRKYDYPLHAAMDALEARREGALAWRRDWPRRMAAAGLAPYSDSVAVLVAICLPEAIVYLSLNRDPFEDDAIYVDIGPKFANNMVYRGVETARIRYRARFYQRIHDNWRTLFLTENGEIEVGPTVLYRIGDFPQLES